MKQKRNLILTVLIAALVIGLLVWRLTPRSLESLSGLDFDQAVSVSAHTERTKYLPNTKRMFSSATISTASSSPHRELNSPTIC